MKIRPVLADTGRTAGSAVHLLNAGWTSTTAVPLPIGGWTLPQQALAIFVEALSDELNKLHALVIKLADEEGRPAYFMPGPDGGGPEVNIHNQVVVPPVPGAPDGAPGQATVFMDLPMGTLWIPAPKHRYVWSIQAGDVTEEIGFWVQLPAQVPVVGTPGHVQAS